MSAPASGGGRTVVRGRFAFPPRVEAKCPYSVRVRRVRDSRSPESEDTGMSAVGVLPEMVSTVSERCCTPACKSSKCVANVSGLSVTVLMSARVCETHARRGLLNCTRLASAVATDPAAVIELRATCGEPTLAIAKSANDPVKVAGFRDAK